MATSQLESPSRLRRQEAIAGALLGMAVGDAIGLPWEGLSARRGRRFFGDSALRHRFVFNRGMVSDDTEHAAMTAQALLAAGDDIGRFRRSLGWRLRFWLLGIPAGIGLGTLRSILKLWIGFPPTRSGVNSAGNGPAMRAPILGVVFALAPETRQAMVAASTCLTHSDPRAQQGALAIATAAALTTNQGPGLFDDQGRTLELIQRELADGEVRHLLSKVTELLDRHAGPEELTKMLGTPGRVSGYMPHTVAAALFCWLRFGGDVRQSVEAAVRLGGDTDTVAGIVGALAGAAGGPQAIPADWIDGLIEWPRSVTWLSNLAERLARRFPDNDAAEYLAPQGLSLPGQLLRNAFFMFVVLGHGLRRLFPPY